MRNYLDISHYSHNLGAHEKVDGYNKYKLTWFSIPNLDDCVGRYHDFHSVAVKIRERHSNPKHQRVNSHIHKELDRFETDNVKRKLRDVFFDQWQRSKEMCTSLKYRHWL